ncbi:hypothetical protein EC973_007436 [Apophysomyces ossiformis]|uniref:LysM domain-containing protein n=1 Tax=Apophysomyces ossiformis TaxID=679940 RepID=A0A8H7EPU6_9FUNG|nr:hypothetical protein EC973_007393 [Apophysomyces ossiformis]KAF7727562.1 hypothetical protein EC973_007436 [Apophysomyces ossiformis]
MKLLAIFSLATLASMALAAPASRCEETYVARGPEKCYKIARDHGIKTSQLKKLNSFINGPCTNIRAGDVLCLREATGNSRATKLKKGHCYSNDDCPGKKCCNLNISRCVNDPDGTICDYLPTRYETNPFLNKTLEDTKYKTSKCKTNDDCPGKKCCNLFTNQCVNDPKGKVCDIIPPSKLPAGAVVADAAANGVASGVPKPKKGQCNSNDDCPGKKCCNLFTNQCVNDPKGKICDIIPPSKFPAGAVVADAAANGVASGVPKLKKGQCSSNDDCPGKKCCNLFTNQCVYDRKGKICDIVPPTKSKETSPAKTPIDSDGKDPVKGVEKDDEKPVSADTPIDLNGKNPFHGVQKDEQKPKEDDKKKNDGDKTANPEETNGDETEQDAKKDEKAKADEKPKCRTSEEFTGWESFKNFFGYGPNDACP